MTPRAYIRVPAVYTPYPGKRHAGNPFVEALPVLGSNKNELHKLIENYPDVPGPAERKLDEQIRIDELNSLGDIVYPRPAYKKLAPSVISNLKEAYYARNPLTVDDRRRRHLMANPPLKKTIPLPADWKNAAKGAGLFGSSGTGKTTFCDVLSLPLQVVIEHTSYHGQPLQCLQVPWIMLQIPHDATLRSLCVQFFAQVDQALGVSLYEKQGRAAASIAEMALLIAQVATSISLGMIFVDELQNLRAARGPQVEFVLNLFSQLIERAGVSLLVAGTPAIETLMTQNFRNIRKLTAGSETRLNSMSFKSAELQDFLTTYWDYQWVKKKRRLTDEIKEAWFAASGGNPALTVMAFNLAQRIEIGGRELIDEVSFARVLQTDMALLQPAIRALRSDNLIALSKFDDLIFDRKYDALRGTINWQRPPEAADDDEFPEITEDPEPSGKTKKDATGKAPTRVSLKPLPTEDPLMNQ